MKIYARMSSEGELDQCAIFDLKPARLGVLMNLVSKHALFEAVVKLPLTLIGFNILPQGGPTDGYISQDAQDKLQEALDYDDDPTEALDTETAMVQTLHVGMRFAHVELIFSSGETWWSEPLDLTELQNFNKG